MGWGMNGGGEKGGKIGTSEIVSKIKIQKKDPEAWPPFIALPELDSPHSPRVRSGPQKKTAVSVGLQSTLSAA